MTTVVLFDAVGTVIKPSPSVVSVYERLGKTYGSRLSTAELKLRIAQGRQKYFQVRGRSGASSSTKDKAEFVESDLVSSDQIEYQLWQQLVTEVFRELPDSSKLFEELWEHFRLPQNWQLFDDAADCWNVLRARGCLIGLASNFDSRLLQLCEAIPLLKTADYVFQSAGVGFRKPSPKFYCLVESSLRDSLASESSKVSELFMVGDDLENDCLGPQREGWSAFWLDRQHQSKTPATKTLERGAIGANGFETVTSLTEFTDRISSQL